MDRTEPPTPPAPGDASIPQVPTPDAAAAAAAPPLTLTAAATSAPSSTFDPRPLASAGSVLSAVARAKLGPRAVTFAESSSDPAGVLRTLEAAEKTEERVVLGDQKDRIITRTPTPEPGAATAASAALSTSLDVKKRITDVVSSWSSGQTDKGLAAIKNGAAIATRDLQNELVKTSPDDKKVQKLQTKAVKVAMKASKKDPLLAREILLILGKDTDKERSISIAQQISQASKKNPAFETVVTDYLKEFITSEAKEKDRTDFFRKTENLPSRIFTAVQNDRLESFRALETRIKEILRSKTVYVKSPTEVDVTQVSQEVRTCMAILTAQMKRIDPMLVELYRHIHSEAKTNYGETAANTQVASCIFLKSVVPSLIIPPVPGLDLQSTQAQQLKVLGKVLQFLINYEGKPATELTMTSGSPSLSDFVAQSHDELLNPFLAQLKKACGIP